MKSGKLYLDCPYSEKDECKSLGGRWDPDRMKWYVPEGENRDVFKRWWQDEKPSGTQADSSNSRYILS